ncbi:homeobox-DDT domain protein RLT3 [Rhododendron vialii]|uniref:homeobox-DDT domain protein RLT3 n=1 Tax=Rhododendron vialii TaxID=182163 RepID=UPI00265F7666|nr:homeobox-DDT domain protein RLT3 [Rhododendron vialii]
MAAKKGVGQRKGKKKEPKTRRLRLHDVLLSPDCILKKVFRKDGPPLGVEFDTLPSYAFQLCNKGRRGSKCSHRLCQDKQRALKVNKACRNSDHACDESQTALKKRKVSKPTMLDYQVSSVKSAPVKKHGIGKGLMTVWRAINPDGGDTPTGVNFNERESTAVFSRATSAPQKPLVQEKKSRKRQPVMRKVGKGTKVQDKRKPPISRRKVQSHNTQMQMPPYREKCELAFDRVICQEDLEQFAKLIDDEELELQELRAGPSPLTCSVHFATSGLHGCSLCKDLLSKFPPNSVVMKLPFYMQPWGSSPELVKKLFKVFHFIYSYAVLLNIRSFTLDEFAQTFHDKESMLLGQIHLSLLKLLVSDVEMELSRGVFPPVSNNGKFIELLHSVENQHNVVEFWKKSLNPLTWTEILRQVFIAAGFGSKSVTARKESLCKEATIMAKYGLSPATLKGELYSILSEQGNKGMKVSSLANSPQIVDLNLAATSDELELLISSALSSDITLFEKISCDAYRLRIHPVMEEAETFDLDSEDFGSVDNDSKDNDIYSSDDDSECSSDHRILDQGSCHEKGNKTLTVYTEIDESHPGEVWLLGLVEGEYSDLSIDEKLNALVALVDLLGAGSSIRMEDRIPPSVESVPSINHYGSGAKIKRSSGKQHSWPSSFGGYIGQMLATKDTTSGLHTVDSSAFLLKFGGNAKSCSQRKYANEMEAEDDLHPMQSVFLGSDRRYNRYWLFLGPCNALDPGHKRIYFESSDDGHWEVIDTEEALCTLLSALDCRGAREAYLLASLKGRETFMRQSIQSDQSDLNVSRDDSSSAVSELDNNISLTEMNNDFSVSSGSILLKTGNNEQRMQKWSCLQAFDAWIWNSFYSDLNAVKYSKRSYLDSLTRCECCHDLYWRDEKHCKTCHTTFELDFDLEERYAIHVATCKLDGEGDMFPNHKVLSSQLQSLKAAIHAIESVMPEGALVGAWIKSAHKLWIKRLRRTSTLAEYMQVLADFVGAINEEWCQSDEDQGPNSVLGEIIASFKTMPQTSSAVAVWLVKVDALIAPFLKRVGTEKKQETVARSRGKHASNL